MVNTIMSWIRAAIETFPIDPEKKAQLLRELLKKSGQEERK